jgi:ferritin-like metal-binding protein YciE
MTTTQTNSAKNAPTINTYLSDMLALENHVRQPLKSQSEDSEIQKSAQASQVIKLALKSVEAHIVALEARLNAVGGHSGTGIKTGVATVLGAAASAVGNVRKTEVSKDLRDDYSALSLTSAGYTMLHATALGLGDSATAALAKSHLTDVADVIMRVNEALPAVVLAELKQEGVAVDASVVTTAERNLQEAWREGGARSGVSKN